MVSVPRMSNRTPAIKIPHSEMAAKMKEFWTERLSALKGIFESL